MWCFCSFLFPFCFVLPSHLHVKVCQSHVKLNPGCEHSPTGFCKINLVWVHGNWVIHLYQNPINISDIYPFNLLGWWYAKENMQLASLHNESFYCLTRNHQSNVIDNELSWYLINLNLKIKSLAMKPTAWMWPLNAICHYWFWQWLVSCYSMVPSHHVHIIFLLNGRWNSANRQILWKKIWNIENIPGMLWQLHKSKYKYLKTLSVTNPLIRYEIHFIITHEKKSGARRELTVTS